MPLDLFRQHLAEYDVLIDNIIRILLIDDMHLNVDIAIDIIPKE